MLLSDQKQSSVKEPAQDVALLKQAVAAYRLGDKDRARELLNTASELNPDNPLIWLWRASVAASYKEAVSSLERVLALDPDNAKARQWMDKLQRARTEALRKAGIEVPEEADGARPTLVKSESAPVAEALTHTEAPSQEEASPETHSEAQPNEQSDRDPLLDLIAERDDQRQEAEQKPETHAGVEGSSADTPAATTGTSEAAPSTTDDTDVLAELLAERQDQTPAVDSSAAEAPPAEGTALKALPAPIQPAAETNSAAQDEDAFAWLRETGVAPDSDGASGEAGLANDQPIAREPESNDAFGPAPAAWPDTETESDQIETSPVHQETADSEASVEPEPAPASSPLVAAEQLACPVCEQMWTEPQRLCPGCGSLTDLALVDEAPRHDGADRAALRAAAKRLEDEIEAAPTAEAHRHLGLVYMNLRQSNDALTHLREAVRLDPSDQDARAAVVVLEKRSLILAVDDSKTIQRMISSVLEKESYRVALAADGLQALSRLEKEMPAVMLLDITMPRMDGYQVCKIVTGNDATKHIPVIMLSGKDGFFDKVRGKMVGASNYITKPFDPTALLKAISKQMPS